MSTKIMFLPAAALAAGTALADENPDAGTADRTPPTVISTSPADGATCVDPASAVSATFSEEMHPRTLSPSTFMLDGPSGQMTGSVKYANRTATLMPGSGLPSGANYKATVTTGARDREGNALAGNYVWRFNTVCAAAAAPVTRAPVAETMVSAFDDRWYIAPEIAYVAPGADGIDSGIGWQLEIGKPLTRIWNLELGLTYRDLDVEDSSLELKDFAYGLNALAFFSRNKSFAPFALLGVGADSFKVTSASRETDPYGTVGIGMLTSPWDWDAAIRAGVQWLRPIGADYDTDGDVIASVGVQIPFGS